MVEETSYETDSEVGGREGRGAASQWSVIRGAWDDREDQIVTEKPFLKHYRCDDTRFNYSCVLLNMVNSGLDLARIYNKGAAEWTRLDLTN